MQMMRGELHCVLRSVCCVPPQEAPPQPSAGKHSEQGSSREAGRTAQMHSAPSQRAAALRRCCTHDAAAPLHIPRAAQRLLRLVPDGVYAQVVVAGSGLQVAQLCSGVGGGQRATRGRCPL